MKRNIPPSNTCTKEIKTVIIIIPEYIFHLQQYANVVVRTHRYHYHWNLKTILYCSQKYWKMAVDQVPNRHCKHIGGFINFSIPCLYVLFVCLCHNLRGTQYIGLIIAPPLTLIPYSALISRNLNFVDGCLRSFRWINFAVPVALGCALMGIGKFRWTIFVEAGVSAKTAKIKSHEI